MSVVLIEKNVINDYQQLLLQHVSSEDNWRIEQELSFVDRIKTENEFRWMLKPIYFRLSWGEWLLRFIRMKLFLVRWNMWILYLRIKNDDTGRIQ